MAEKFKLDEIRVRLVPGDPLYSSEPIDSASKAVDLLSEVMSQLDREEVVVLNLDTKLKPLSFHVASIGDRKQSIVDPAAVFRQAIMQNSDSVLLLHNHPSSSIEPSHTDDELTKRIVEAGKLMGVPVLDHIIVGGYTGQTYSYREGSPDTAMLFQDSRNPYVVAEYKEQQKQNRQERIKEIMSELDHGVEMFFTSEKYQHFLKTMQQFHQFSFQNTLLIALQRPDATRVASYDTWKKLGRQVQKGEHGIKVIVPTPVKLKVEKAKNRYEENAAEEPEERQIMRFKIGHVFDLAQTRGEPLPELDVSELTGEVMDFDRMMSAIQAVSSVPISFENISSGAKGFYNDAEKRIVIQSGMSESQTIKTALHELAHSRIHNREVLENEGFKTRETKEVEAESVGFCVTSVFGIDASSYSFPYIASWSGSRSLRELRQSMDTIRETSQDIIRGIENELEKKREQEQEKMTEQDLENVDADNTEEAEEKKQEDKAVNEDKQKEIQTVTIYQLKDTARDIAFVGLAELENMRRTVEAENYRQVYEYQTEDPADLDQIYEEFNVDRPSDFEGHSLSVSDLIVIDGGFGAKAFFVDSFGFTEMPEMAEQLGLQEEVRQLASELDRLAYEHDFYAYRDAVDNRKVHIQGIEESIHEGETESIVRWLDQMIDESRNPAEAQTAWILRSRLEEVRIKIEEKQEKQQGKAM